MTSDNSNNGLNEKAGSGSGPCGILIAIVCLVLEAIIFAFVLIGTPVDCYQSRVATAPRSCYSMWGSKTCGAHRANPAGSQYKGFPNGNIETTMNAAAAFAIISIGFTLVSLVLCVFLVCKCISKFIPMVVSFVAFFTILIVWACQAGVYNRTYIRIFTVGRKIRDNYKYAGSFGLFLTAWILQAIQMVLIFFA